jgi:hypothetical protein
LKTLGLEILIINQQLSINDIREDFHTPAAFVLGPDRNP